MATKGGPIKPVRVITDADLRANGGAYVLQAGPAIPVYGFLSPDRSVEGGAALPVYVVTAAQIASGQFKVAGESALPVASIADIAHHGKTIGPQAIPVYVVNGSEWPGGAVSPPAQPTGLTATPTSLTQIDLAWTDAATDETGYKVYRSTDDVTYSLIDTIAANLEAYSDTTISAGDVYYYKVAAYNAGGESLSDPAGAGIFQPDETTGIDTFIRADAADNNCGITTPFIAGKAALGIMRPLIMFSGFADVPATATVVSATLTLYCESEVGTTDFVVGVHRALTQWYEGTKNNAAPDAGQDGSTWNLRNANGAVAWAGGAGGGSGTDYAAVATDSEAITAPLTAFSWTVTADLAAWVAGTAANYGWWVINTNEVDANLKRFTSSDGATAGNRPTLMISLNP